MAASALRAVALAALIQPWIVLAADDVPAWLRTAASAALPQFPAKVNSVVLLNEEHTTALGSGKLSTTTRTAIRILKSQGVNVSFYDQYESSSGKFRDFRAWMISPSGKVKKYGKTEILDVACAENDVYNECRRRMVSGKRDSEAGAVFGYESTIEYESFSLQLSFHFHDSSPVQAARFIVTLPAGWELKASSFNGAPEPAMSNGSYTWQMENLPALEREPYSPGFRSLAAWTGVSLISPASKRSVLSWPDAAKLLAELNKGQEAPDEEISAKAKSLTAGAKTELDKIRAIGRFTQALNYVSIQLNVSKGGGYRPHSAPQAFRKLYGDCKDKANLTRAMLAAVGITAYPVAIYAGDRTHVDQKWPSLGAFNHAISAIRVGPDTKAPAVLEHPALGRLLFFDSTDPYVPAGYLPDHEQGSLALVGVAEGGDLVRVPAGIAVASDRDRQVEAVLAADGSIYGEFKDRRSGEELSEAVSAYRSSQKDDYVKSVERSVGRSIPGSNTTGINVRDSAGEFVIEGKFAAQRFAQRPQPGILIFKAALLDHGDLRLTEKSRKYPIVLGADSLRETVRIKLPSEFKVDELPKSVQIDSEFGKYQSSWSVEAGSLLFRRTFEMNAQTAPAAKYVELKRFLDAVSGSAGSPVVLIK